MYIFVGIRPTVVRWWLPMNHVVKLAFFNYDATLTLDLNNNVLPILFLPSSSC